MTTPRASMLVIGQVVVSAQADGLETAQAIGLADGRVVAVGSRQEVADAAAPNARVVDAGPVAVVPGLCDFHLHLVGMARARREVRLDEAADSAALIAEMRRAAANVPAGEWLRGRGWHDDVLAATDLAALDDAIGRRPALVHSHDGHSAWASAAALRAAGIGEATPDPSGGRLERGADGRPNGILRERAADLLDPVAGGLVGPGLERALDETLVELASHGITAAVDAGDATDDGGSGPYAALGDRASALLASSTVEGRLRLSVNMPAAAIGAASERGLRTNDPVAGRQTIRIGWAKAFVDGALGSRTAALFEPYTCGGHNDAGIARLDTADLAAIVAAGRQAGIALAIHAIGDRGAAMVLDALEHGPSRQRGTPPDRMEHLQLLRGQDAARLAASDITASIQPIHCASDRPLVNACWADRTERAYPWRPLQDAGTRIAFGSDAPIESPNPWLGLHAAVHRRFATDGTPDWHPEHAFGAAAALAGYTSGPALAGGWPDQGHLRVGAHADLAILNLSLERLLAAGDDLASARSVMTLVDGREVATT
jgi:predicted amidohydrolase YtcJ